MSIQLIIGTDDFSDYVISTEREQHLCKPVAILDIVLAPDLPRDIVTYESVVFYENGTRVFTGYTQGVAKARLPILINLHCADVLVKAQDTWITDQLISHGETVVHWVAEFLKKSKLWSYELNCNQRVYDGFGWQYTTAMEAIATTLKVTRYQIKADRNGKIILAANHKSDEIDGTISEYISFERTQDDSWIRNRAVVFGNGNTIADKTLSNPYIPGEVRATVVASGSIYNSCTAYQIVDEMLNEFSTPLDIKRVVVPGDPKYEIGQTIHLVDTWSGYDNNCLLTSIMSTYNSEGYTLELTFDEKCINFWGWDNPPTYASYIYASTLGAGVYRASYNGVDADWAEHNNGLSSLIIHDMKMSADGDLWAATPTGVYFNLGADQTWVKKTLPEPGVGLGEPTPYALTTDTVDNGTAFVLTNRDVGGSDRYWLYKTFNSGSSWSYTELIYGGRDCEQAFASTDGSREHIFAIDSFLEVDNTEKLYISKMYSYDGGWTDLEPGIFTLAVGVAIGDNLWQKFTSFGAEYPRARTGQFLHNGSWSDIEYSGTYRGDIVKHGAYYIITNSGGSPYSTPPNDYNKITWYYESGNIYKGCEDFLDVNGVPILSTSWGMCLESYEDQLFVSTKPSSGNRHILRHYGWHNDEPTFISEYSTSSGDITDIFQHDGSLFMIAHGVLFKRNDTTKSWSDHSGTCTSYINCGYSYKGNLWVGCDDGKVYAFDDTTNTYSEEYEVEDSTGNPADIVDIINYKGCWFIAAANTLWRGIYKTCDFDSAISIPEHGRTNILETDGTYVYISVIYGTTPMILEYTISSNNIEKIYRTNLGTWAGVNCTPLLTIFGDFGSTGVVEYDGSTWESVGNEDWLITDMPKVIEQPLLSDDKLGMYDKRMWGKGNESWLKVDDTVFTPNCSCLDIDGSSILIGSIEGGDNVLQKSNQDGINYYEMSKGLSKEYRITNILIGEDNV